MKCELCKLVAGNVITKKHFENEDWIVVDCKTCQIPMAVYKKHGNVAELMDKRNSLRYDLENDWQCHAKGIRWEQRTIKDHFHFHMQSYVPNKKYEDEIKEKLKAMGYL